MKPKLIRDKIPDIIRQDNEVPVVHFADHNELTKALHDKLQEEVGEFLEMPCEEEIADILEVLHGLAKHHGFSFEDIEHLRVQKKKERGGFDAGTILETIKKE